MLVAKLRGISKGLSDQRKYRVLVVDDSALPRAAARTMLGSVGELRLVGEASSGRQALEAISELKPDVVLMDVHMPGMDGPATAKELLLRYPKTKVIAWTVSESSDDLLRMMQAGCAGYVLKDAGPGELHRALLAAMRSESPVPRKMIPEVLRRVAESTPLSRGSAVALTSREMEILRGIAKGHTTKRLAREVGLAAPSVESHLHNIFRKLSATNRGEAVSAALKMGLITLADL
ncbi:MAG TPA: response regulator transcription factor [Candidatus Micrarchaeaceae archaeon]|nr:response regulator transcription factor [Candidatus Micrarchaeaceae archaeon]